MYTAVIVEPRTHPALEIVLLNFNKNLDDNWEFLIYHGNNNKEFIEAIISNNNISRRCTLISLNVSNLTITNYNLLLYSTYFYENIHTEIFLVFQIDTLISEKFKNNINLFLVYDYVGAPWKDNNSVGNGGLSLRKKTKMLELLKQGGYKKNNEEVHWEDIFFSNTINNTNNIVLHKPSFELAKKFSVETIFNYDTFGLHKPWEYLKDYEIYQLKSHFPDLEKLINLFNPQKQTHKYQDTKFVGIKKHIGLARNRRQFKIYFY